MASRILLALVTALSSASAQTRDTAVFEVGHPAIDGRMMLPHAARVRVYRGDSLVSQWVNELTLGDSAGRRVMRWVTTSEPVAANPNRPLSVLRQTYDARTLAPLGYHSSANTGALIQLAIEGTRVRGTRRSATDTAARAVDITLDRSGFFSGASDLVPIAAGLKPGHVFIAPVWNPNSPRVEDRVFAVFGDTSINVEGTTLRSRKVEERRRGDGSLYATWYLLLDKPYMVYGEVPLPDGRVQRMTEVGIPVSKD